MGPGPQGHRRHLFRIDTLVLAASQPRNEATVFQRHQLPSVLPPSPPRPLRMHYRFGDWIIDSALTLPELPLAPAATRPADLKLTVDTDSRTPPARPRRWLHHWRDINGGRMLSIARTVDRGFLLRFPGTLEARLDAQAQNMLVRPLEYGDPATMRHQLIDQLLPRAVAYRGRLLLHAGAVVIEGRTILVVGESGWGKSTLVAALHAQGHPLLTDDCVLLHSKDTHAYALGTYPSLRLLPDTLARVMADSQQNPLSEGQNKHRVGVLPAPLDGLDAPVAAVYLLQAPCPNARTVSTTLLSPGQACIEIMKHSFQLDVSDRAQHTRQLGDAAAVATRVPAFELSYPRNFERLPEVIAHLKHHLSVLAPGSGQTGLKTCASLRAHDLPQGQA